MIETIFLGTGCMQPTKNRNHPGVLLKYKKENILFDCGEGIQRQMRIAGVKPAKITILLISHWHGDHVFGIPGLLNSMGADHCDHTLKIFGPKGTKKKLLNLMKVFNAKDIVPFEVTDVTKGKILDTNDFYLETQLLNHSSVCQGYNFTEKDRRKIKIIKASKLGLTGPILGKLQQGNDVIFKKKKITSNEVTYFVKGKKIVYITDTRPCKGAEILAQNANLLILEATHLDKIKEKTEKAMHMTVKESAILASLSNVKKLILFHISPRYKTTDEIVEEARTYFDETIVAEDLMRVRI